MHWVENKNREHPGSMQERLNPTVRFSEIPQATSKSTLILMGSHWELANSHI